MASVSQISPQITLPAWPINHVLEITSPEVTWLVGGTVRDLLLCRPLHDWDFVTKDDGIQLAKQVANHFQGAFYVLDPSRETGRAVVYPPSATSPITLDFASLRAPTLTGDLQLRDFTINAMAMTLYGKLVDPLYCIADLVQKTIRMTTPACFEQDPVRLMRAIRQANDLDYTIDEETYIALCEQAYRIKSISPERILAELRAMLSSHETASSIHQLWTTYLLPHICPELAAIIQSQTSPNGVTTLSSAWENTEKTLTVVDHILQAIRNNDEKPQEYFANQEIWHKLSDILSIQYSPLDQYFDQQINVEFKRSTLLRWAALLHLVPVEQTRQHLISLRMPNKSINVICRLIQTHALLNRWDFNITPREIYQFYKQVEQMGPGVIILALAVAVVEPQSAMDPKSMELLIQNAEVLLQAFFESDPRYINPVPFLRGDALIELGIPQGPEIGRMLEHLLEAQVTGEVTSPKSAEDFVKNELSNPQKQI